MRGQAHTLEAFAASALLITGLVFAAQATAVTPLSASTSNQHIENQQAAMGEDVLTVTHANGDLASGILYWDSSADEFVGAEHDGHYTSGVPDQHPMSDALNESFARERMAFNIEIDYWTGEEGGGRGHQWMVRMGKPSDNAVTVSKTMTLYNHSTIPSGANSTGAGMTLEELDADANEDVYVPYAGGGSNVLFNTVEVRITVWQM